MTAFVTNSGLARISSALLALPFWVKAGTGVGAAKIDNDVAIPSPEPRVLCTSSFYSWFVPNDSIEITGTITGTVDEVITEYAIFDDVGNMCLYTETPGNMTLRPGDSIVFTICLTFR